MHDLLTMVKWLDLKKYKIFLGHCHKVQNSLFGVIFSLGGLELGTLRLTIDLWQMDMAWV